MYKVNNFFDNDDVRAIDEKGANKIEEFIIY